MLLYERWSEFRTGSPALKPENYDWNEVLFGGNQNWSAKFRFFKFAFDGVLAVLAMPLIALVALLLAIVNPFLNPGPLFYWHKRMGYGGSPFWLLKFRTMKVEPEKGRCAKTGLEQEQITRFGRFLRKSRLDELPNFFNVLRGQMSVVGPRPDTYAHAKEYVKALEGYWERHRVKPGITGLAQVEMGYAEGMDETALKAKYDNLYASRSCGRLDLYITWKTMKVLVTGYGAK